jgi:hypothetical protein
LAVIQERRDSTGVSAFRGFSDMMRMDFFMAGPFSIWVGGQYVAFAHARMDQAGRWVNSFEQDGHRRSRVRPWKR